MSSAIDAQSLLTPPSLPWVTPRPNPHLLAGSCSYSLADGEVPPLLDALTKNSSLTRLNLAFAGLDWSGIIAAGGAVAACVLRILFFFPHTSLVDD